MKIKPQTVLLIGWIASIMAGIMYASYVDQIRLNLAGQTGSIILPVITFINCLTWIIYALLKTKKDWPLVFCNLIGITASSITVMTALI